MKTGAAAPVGRNRSGGYLLAGECAADFSGCDESPLVASAPGGGVAPICGVTVLPLALWSAIYLAATRSCTLASSAASFFATSASFSFFAAAAAFCSSVSGGSLATASPKLATTTPAAISARNVVLIRLSSLSAALSGDSRTGRRARGRRHRMDLARLDLVVPVLVVLARPFLVDVAGPHRIVRAGHAERAHVDVAEAAEHEQDCAGRMQYVRDLHRPAGLVEIGKVENEPGDADQDAEHDRPAPEPDLLAGVVLARGRILSREQPAEALDP